MRRLRWWGLALLALTAPMMGQFIINSNQMAVSVNTSLTGSWPYTQTDASRTTPFANTLFGGELSLAMQWYLLSPANRDKLLDEGQKISGFVGDQLLHKVNFSIETEHSLLINFGDKSDGSPMLQQKYQPRSYYGRLSLALSYHQFIRFQINTLAIGAMASSIDEHNLTYLYIAPLQRIRIDLPIDDNFLRVEYEGSLLSFAYNFEERASADISDSNTLIGNFRIGWFMPSFYSTSERNKPYLGAYIGMQIQRHFAYESPSSGIDWSRGATISRLQVGFSSWLASPQWNGSKKNG